MSKIIGVTVGTPINPERLREKLNIGVSDVCRVAYILDNATCDSYITEVKKNTAFRVTISPNDGCKLKSIKTIMNGEIRNERNYPNGSEASFTWSETYVTGDLTVVAIAELAELPKNGVQTVNGKAPDANGNVEIEVSGGNVDKEQIEQSVEKYLTEHPAGCALTIETITVGGDSGDSGTTEPESIPVTGLSLDLTAYSATVGGAFYINPVVIPSNATNRGVSWESSNNSVATVDGNGYVECIAQGDAIIACITADGGYRATCSVAVAADSGGDSGGEPDPVYYTITKNLTNATINNSATSVVAGSAYTANITAASGYELSSISVVMGGVNITGTAVSGNTITIASVTGNVSIIATATAQQTTGGKVQFSTLTLNSGSIKAGGAHAAGDSERYITIPYTEGMTVRTLWNTAWPIATYPAIQVVTGGEYETPDYNIQYEEDGATKKICSIGGKLPHMVESIFTGYAVGSEVVVNMLIGNATNEAMDDSDWLYYIPGGES